MRWWVMQAEWVYLRDSADAAARILNDYDYDLQMTLGFNFIALSEILGV